MQSFIEENKRENMNETDIDESLAQEANITTRQFDVFMLYAFVLCMKLSDN